MRLHSLPNDRCCLLQMVSVLDIIMRCLGPLHVC
jgi:hypothetical protein